MWWFILATIFIIVSFWNFFIRPLSYWSKKGVKQVNPWPILGDAWMTFLRRKSISEFVLWLYNTYPDERYIGIYQFSTPALVIRDLELIKQITIRDFDHFTDHRNRTFANPDKDPISMGNLFLLKGQRWRDMRAIVSGSFTSSKMKSIYSLVEKTSANFSQYFLDKKDDLIEVELKDCFTRVATDLIATGAFGIEIDSLKEPNNAFYSIGRTLTNYGSFLMNIKFIIYFLLPKVATFFGISLFDPKAVKYFRDIIYDAIKLREEKGIIRPDMINLLLETRKGIRHEERDIIETGFATAKEYFKKDNFKSSKQLADHDIAAQAFLFFVAGFHTISIALSFCCYELALNQDIQDILRKEIEETPKTINGQVTYESLLSMKYLDMVVSETLRKQNPVVFVDRECTKSYIIEPVKANEKPVYIEKGQLIWIPYHGIHRDPKFFPNPEKFDPERFSAENKNKIISNTFNPFSIGPRNCLGSRFALLELKVVLYRLLLNFKIVPTAKTDIPLKLAKSSTAHTAADGFWVGFKRIQH